MVKTHHVPNHIYTDFHIINFTIVISQSPNTSLIIIMNTPVENAKPAGQSSSFLDICILIPTNPFLSPLFYLILHIVFL